MLPEIVDFRAMESILIGFLEWFLERKRSREKRKKNQRINPNKVEEERKEGRLDTVGFLNAVNKLAIQCHDEEGFVTFIGVA